MSHGVLWDHRLERERERGREREGEREREREMEGCCKLIYRITKNFHESRKSNFSRKISLP